VVSVFASATGMPENEARTELNQLRSQVEAVRDNPDRVATEVRNFLGQYADRAKQQARQVAATVQEGATVGAWVTFGVLAATFIVAILGALAGIPSLGAWRFRWAPHRGGIMLPLGSSCLLGKGISMSHALLVYPAFPPSYWGYTYALDFVGKKSAMPPLGLLTVAAMFPEHNWHLKVVDMNVSPLTDTDLEWADYVFTSTMIVQKQSFYEVVKRCNQRNLPVIAGGPHPTSY
jgi:hypothetical protein